MYSAAQSQNATREPSQGRSEGTGGSRDMRIGSTVSAEDELTSLT